MKPSLGAALRPMLFAAALAAASFSPIAAGSPDARASAEIKKLLSAIDHSDCTFLRSGKAYSGTQARRHLEFKLGFVRSRLESADQFVHDLASASSTTGEPYHIRCGDRETEARTWLDAQLKTIRAGH